ncbi:MAG: hypothetical protein OEV81_10435 [Betaproteobacteria bacterium]|nr:hypothetical protein [Betaproteobacteria bacterium]MDH5222778.1 hypothetical protein [Betaproteobacteria bacterium]MDH5352080.1 hypothetical protein [Betaproteobacteria bacterium]
MALETPIASFQFSNGPLRGTQLALYAARLLHQGAGQMESITLSAVAAVRVGFERDVARITWGGVLIVAAALLFLAAGPLSGLAADAAAEITGKNAVAQLLRGTLHALGALASVLPAAGVAALLGGGALAAFGWIGMTTVVLSLPAAERAYSVRGQSRMLVDFAELLAERVAQRAH